MSNLFYLRLFLLFFSPLLDSLDLGRLSLMEAPFSEQEFGKRDSESERGRSGRAKPETMIVGPRPMSI